MKPYPSLYTQTPRVERFEQCTRREILKSSLSHESERILGKEGAALNVIIQDS